MENDFKAGKKGIKVFNLVYDNFEVEVKKLFFLGIYIVIEKHLKKRFILVPDPFSKNIVLLVQKDFENFGLDV